MALHLYSLTVDARDHRALARWWAEVLGWRIGYEDEHECEVLPPEASPDPVDETATWLDRRTMLSFVPVPEGKTVKNRVHLDLVTSDREAEVERLVGLGATRLADHDEWGHVWTTLADPAGNEFCVAARRARVTPGA